MAHRAHPFAKALEAFYEGKFFRKTGHMLVKWWLMLWKAIDMWFGKVTRYFMMKRVPVQPDKIIFIPFQGDYSCNLKYITEELIREGIDCQIVWSVRAGTLKHSFDYPSQIKFVEQYTTEYYRDLASSKFWVANSVDFFKRKVYKKKEQVLIETWHGSLGIKRFDASVNAGHAWVRAARYCGKVANYCISNSEFENGVFRGTFWPTTEILLYGHPRNDILIGNEEMAEKASERARSLLGIDDDVHVALYAPTFRDDHQFDAYSLDFNRLKEALEKRFGGEWLILTRFHPTVRQFAKSRSRMEGSKSATSYDDIQELMCIADLGITDYSSWIYDYMLTRKPGIIFATDLDSYYTERGFYFPLDSTPFPICIDNDQVEKAIAEFDLEKYQKGVEEFLAGKGCIEDGHASERVVAKIVELMGGES